MIEQIEQRLGSYRLIQLLGSGSFADVYLGEHLYLNLAVAVKVYEWLCGYLPFEGLTAYLSNEHLFTAPPSLCDEHPEIPQVVEKLVMKGLSKDPGQRFIDVLSFVKALEVASQADLSPVLIAASPANGHVEASISIEGLDMCSYNAPVPITSLVGREWELQALRDLLLQSEARLVTLTGTGGIGKTHLALSFGNEVREEFAQGVCYVPFSIISQSKLVTPAIIQALGLLEKEDQNPDEYLKTSLRDKQLLLILDGFEHVLANSVFLADLLSACPQLKILVTSRALLHIGGEYEFPVRPLEIPDLRQRNEPDSLLHVASVALFVQRAHAMLPGFQLTDENASDIAAICACLEGVPLAIELAVEQSKMAPPKLLLSRLEHPLDVLAGRRRDRPERQQSLLKALKWNDDLLSPDEQVLFRRFGVFIGGCSLQALDAVSLALGGLTISVADGVQALIDTSLLQYVASNEGEPRLTCLEMIRQYAQAQLTESGEFGKARDAHADYYLALAIEASLDKSLVLKERLKRETGNLQAALQWLVACNRPVEAQHLSHLVEDTQAGASTLACARMVSRGKREEEIPLSRLSSKAAEPFRCQEFEALTTRETEVLGLLALGLSNKQIAGRLIISPHTVNGHVHSIFGKLALNSRSAATRYALEHRLA